MPASFTYVLLASIVVFASTACSAGAPADNSVASSDQHFTQANPTLAAACGGGAWLSTSSFATIEGSYTRINAAATGAIATVTFSNVTSPVHFRVDGSFSRTLEGVAASSPGDLSNAGTFEGLPDNPAFESAITFVPTSGTPEIYYTLGMKLDADGNISDICMEHVVGPTAPEPPVILERAAATAPAVDAGSD